jgi:hypothetical protein
MTPEEKQALDMAILDALVDFKMGVIKIDQALKEIKKAFEYYSKPENERD